MTQIWIPHVFPQIIREAQVNYFGHMDNIAYIQVFEAARWEMLTERGYGFDTISKLQQGPVVLGIDVHYRKEVFLRQSVRIETQTQSYDGKVESIKQAMLSEGGEVHCYALIKLGLFDTRTRKLMAPSEAWLRACGQ
jgi:acyl-CoA thioester hydrolase